GSADGRDGLKEQLEAVLLGRARDACDPVHLAMPVGDAILLVDVDAIASFVLGRVAGNVRGAHDARDTFGVGFDLHYADARADRQRVRAPHEAVVANSL